MISPEDFNDRDIEAYRRAYFEIQERRSYGLRKVGVEEKSTILVWNNADEKWFVSSVVEPNTEITVDANQIVVPYSPGRMKRIIDSLPPLPLYSASVQAKQRGVPWEMATQLWILGQSERREIKKIRKEFR